LNGTYLVLVSALGNGPSIYQPNHFSDVPYWREMWMIYVDHISIGALETVVIGIDGLSLYFLRTELIALEGNFYGVQVCSNIYSVKLDIQTRETAKSKEEAPMARLIGRSGTRLVSSGDGICGNRNAGKHIGHEEVLSNTHRETGSLPTAITSFWADAKLIEDQYSQGIHSPRSYLQISAHITNDQQLSCPSIQPTKTRNSFH
jgi:hypothetical protein